MRDRRIAQALARSAILAALVLAALGSQPAEAQVGLDFHAVTPCRLVDTRHDGGAYGDAETRTYNFHTSIPYTGTGACSTIPSAAALLLTVNFQVSSQMAYLTVYPDDASLPTTSTVVAYYNGHFYVNTALVPTGSDGGIKVYAQYAGNVVIDINGYFAP